MKRQLPGDFSHFQQVAQMVRVNQAGEYGAARIYAGQLAALKHTPTAPLLKHMQQQEEVHLRAFNEMLVKRRIRPTLLSPLWHVTGFALGYLTAKMGEKAAMACTVAVEEVIDQHYASQQHLLESLPEETELKAAVTQFRAEELEHRDIGLAHGAESAPFYKFLSAGIKATSRAAIWLSKRL